MRKTKQNAVRKCPSKIRTRSVWMLKSVLNRLPLFKKPTGPSYGNFLINFKIARIKRKFCKQFISAISVT